VSTVVISFIPPTETSIKPANRPSLPTPGLALRLQVYSLKSHLYARSLSLDLPLYSLVFSFLLRYCFTLTQDKKGSLGHPRSLLFFSVSSFLPFCLSFRGLNANPIEKVSLHLPDSTTKLIVCV